MSSHTNLNDEATVIALIAQMNQRYSLNHSGSKPCQKVKTSWTLGFGCRSERLRLVDPVASLPVAASQIRNLDGISPSALWTTTSLCSTSGIFFFSSFLKTVLILFHQISLFYTMGIIKEGHSSKEWFFIDYFVVNLFATSSNSVKDKINIYRNKRYI